MVDVKDSTLAAVTKSPALAGLVHSSRYLRVIRAPEIMDHHPFAWNL